MSPDRKVPVVRTTLSGPEGEADLGHDARHAVALDEQVIDGLLEQREVGLVLEPVPDGALVQDAVGLGARGPHRRTLARIQDAELDPRVVRGERHRPAERVDFLDQVALADPADRRVAGHLAQRFDAVSQQQRARTDPRRGERGLGAGVATADHNDVETLGKVHDERVLPDTAILKEPARRRQRFHVKLPTRRVPRETSRDNG